MRFQLSILAPLALLFASASATGPCAAGEFQMCCHNITDYKVGYYCGTPKQDFPCFGDPPLKAMCCTSADLTPRGYTGSNCRLVDVPGTPAPTDTPAPKPPTQCKRSAKRAAKRAA